MLKRVAVLMLFLFVGCTDVERADYAACQQVKNTADVFKTAGYLFTDQYNDVVNRREAAVTAVVKERDKLFFSKHTTTRPAPDGTVEEVVVITPGELAKWQTERESDLADSVKISQELRARGVAFRQAIDEMVSGVHAYAQAKADLMETQERMTKAVQSLFSTIGGAGATTGIIAVAGGL